MTLDTYLSHHSLTCRAFAERCGLHPTTIQRIVLGQLRPLPKTAARIIAATDSEVRFEDLYADADKSEAA